MNEFNNFFQSAAFNIDVASYLDVENGKFSVGIDILTKICNTLGARIEIVKE